MTPEKLYAMIQDKMQVSSPSSTEDDLTETMTLAVVVAFEAFTPLFEESVESPQNNALIMLDVALVHANETDTESKRQFRQKPGLAHRHIH